MRATFRMAWKEYRQQLSFWVAIVLLSLFAAFVCMALVPNGSFAVGNDDFLGPIFRGIIYVLATTGGVVAGALLFAGEYETRTTWFLNLLPARRETIWLGKVLAGAMLTLVQALLLCLVWMVAYSKAWSQPWSYADGALWEKEFVEAFQNRLPSLILLVSLAFEGFAWAALASTLSRSVMAAVGLTVGFSTIAWIISVGVYIGQQEYLYLIPRSLLGGMAFLLSLFVYSAPARSRARRAQQSTVPKPSSLGVLIWLSVRQSWALWIGLASCSVATGVVVAFYGVIAWPAATLLIGVICGLHVFQPDQLDERFRFFGDQRIPRTRVWFTKVFVGFLIAVLLLGFMATLASVMTLGSPIFQGNMNPGQTWYQLFVEKQVIPGFVPLAQFLPVWAVYGFTVGLLCGQLFRKSVVSSMVAQGLSVLLLLAWLPSIACGGLPTWQLYVVPLMLLFASWAFMRPWLSSRGYERPALYGIAGLGLLVVLWMAGSIWYRMAAIPDVDPSFDPNRYVASIPQGEKNKAKTAFLVALKELKKHQTLVTQKLDPDPKPGDDEPPEGVDSVSPEKLLSDKASELKKEEVENIWKKLDPWVTEIRAGTWDEKLAKACDQPFGALVDPRMFWHSNNDDVILLATLPSGAVYELLFCSLQQLRNGNVEEASRRLVTAFRVIRHVRPYEVGSSGSRRDSTEIERRCFVVLRKVLRKLNALPAPKAKGILRSLLDTLKEQETAFPTALEIYKASYVSQVSLIETYGLQEKRPLAVQIERKCQLVPWEMERQRRLRNLLVASQVWVVQQKPWELPKMPDSEMVPWQLQGRALWNAGVTIPGSPGTAVEKNVWRGLYERELKATIPSVALWHLSPLSILSSRANAVLALRKAQLQVAQRLYFAETGNRTTATKDLVPKYFREVPRNPVTGEAMTEIPALEK